MKQVEAMDAKTFFTMAMELMKQHPPHPTDQVRLDRMARIGIAPEGFAYDALPGKQHSTGPSSGVTR